MFYWDSYVSLIFINTCLLVHCLDTLLFVKLSANPDEELAHFQFLFLKCFNDHPYTYIFATCAYVSREIPRLEL